MIRTYHPPTKPKRRRRRGLTLATALLSLCQLNSIALADAQLDNQAVYRYRDKTTGRIYEGSTGVNSPVSPEPLIDPLGQILACDGSVLSDYNGYSIAFYEPDASGLAPGNLLDLTFTEFPEVPNNGVPGGKPPNVSNINPFSLTNADAGTYNFLFDPSKPLTSPINAGLNQSDVGSQYILVVNPPDDSGLEERRVLLTILSSTGGVNNSIIRYEARALDGIPLSATGGTQLTDTVVEVLDAESQGLNLFSLALGMVLCSNDQVRIEKTADRGAVQPGDTAVYRLNIKNLAEVPLDELTVTDELPLGFRLLPEATRATIDGQTVAIDTEASRDGLNVTFTTPNSIPVNGSLDIIYAVQITPDAIRGDGRNSAAVDAERTDNDFAIQDGPVSHQMRLDPGILSNCGTLLGRVFVDKNFDGEQQPGEPGVPNAVIFLDDGNRIVTDENGLYSVDCVLAGRRTGALDLSSLPGYTLAPNLYFRERNSQSRLVNLAPGGLVRMNFAVTPTFQEEAAQ
ncbi:MAG: DUF11 domain-containing protein [Leptolyngbya sp. SIO1E4]|nr:DUF11 domain-containing protein [Leptolyngbya sp. SIO1E4]